MLTTKSPRWAASPSRDAGSQQPRTGLEPTGTAKQKAAQNPLWSAIVTRPVGATDAKRPVVQRKPIVGSGGDPYEREADRVARQVTNGTAGPAPAAVRPADGRIQRKCAACARGGTQCPACEEEEEAVRLKPLVASTPGLLIQRQPLPATPPSPDDEVVPAGLLAEDTASELLPGQLRKSEFLAEVKAQVCAGIEPILTAAGQTTDGCPYLGRLFPFLGRRSAASLEAMLRRFAAEPVGALTARAYIPAIVERARAGAAEWVESGVIGGLPEGLSIARFADLLSPGSVSAGAGGGEVQRKTRDGAAVGRLTPSGVRARLGHGRPLDGSVRSRMEPAFGTAFSRVHLHTDAEAAALSRSLHARAFTVGEHIAFGPNEYRPGTPAGDALIAHELAHVLQQRGAREDTPTSRKADTPAAAGDHLSGVDPAGARLEAEADDSALRAVAALWGETGDLIEGYGRIGLTSGWSLRLQRCGDGVCPPGFCWQVATTTAAAVHCNCIWRCFAMPTSGPAFTDPNAPRPSVPTDTRWGMGALGTSGGPTTGVCSCIKLEEEGRGTVCDPPLASQPALGGSRGLPRGAGRPGSAPRGRSPGRGRGGPRRVPPRPRTPARQPRAHRPAREVARDGRWPSTTPEHPNSGLRPHFEKHGHQVGAQTVQQYNQSARQTILNGRRFTYRDRASDEPRVGYWDSSTGYFTATRQSGQSARGVTILTHFPQTWQQCRLLPGFSTGE
jgi:hypothetical protein